MRESADFYFDCGDAVKAGNIAIPKRPDPVWQLLKTAGCTAGVPGNREFHVFEQGFRAKLRGCMHPILAANLEWSNNNKSGSILPNVRANVGYSQTVQLAFFDNTKRILPYHIEVDAARSDQLSPLPHAIVVNGVGIFGLMAQMVTEKMAARKISAFVNTSFLLAAKKCVEALRDNCKVVICLSHLGLARDVDLASNTSGIDLILGAHSHKELDPPIRVGDTWICQAGAFGRVIGRYVWDSGLKEARLFPLD